MNLGIPLTRSDPNAGAGQATDRSSRLVQDQPSQIQRSAHSQREVVPSILGLQGVMTQAGARRSVHHFGRGNQSKM